MNKTYRIFIYDDNQSAIYELKNYIVDFFAKKQYEVELQCFNDYAEARELLKSSECRCDAFFMDIELDKGKSGIEFADLLIRTYPNIKIVFVTAYADKYSQAIFMQSRELRPYGYITKPLNSSVVERILTLMFQNDTKRSNRYIEFKKEKHTIKIKYDSILYIESYKRKLIIHLIGGKKEEVYGKISETVNVLPKGFSMCHRSYILNMDHIYAINENKNAIELINGETVFIGATKRSSFMTDFFKYKGGLINV